MHSVVAGVGDLAARDRAVGPEVVRRLQRCELPDVAFIVAETWDALQVAELQGADRLVVIAAVADGGVPGRMQMTVLERPRSVVPRAPEPALDPFGQVLAMAGMPPRLVVYTVWAGDVSAGTGFTAAVGAVLDRLVALVAQEVGRCSGVPRRA